MTKALLLFAFLSLSLFAEESMQSFPFFGPTGTYSKLDFDKTKHSKNAEQGFGGLRYGKQTLDWRTMFTLSGNDKIQDFSMEIDKILLDDIFGYPQVRPYLGANIGFIHDKDKHLDTNNGYYFGGAFGFLVYITDNIDMDISYHYDAIKDIDAFDTMRGGSFALHYFY